MKRLIIIVIIALTFIVGNSYHSGARMPQLRAASGGGESVIPWTPVCRHNAIFWASIVRDQGFSVRFMFGRMYDTENWKDADGMTTYTWHVQPQVKLGESWYYFKVENDEVVIMNMPLNWKRDWYMLPKDYVDWLFSIQRECE